MNFSIDTVKVFDINVINSRLEGLNSGLFKAIINIHVLFENCLSHGTYFKNNDKESCKFNIKSISDALSSKEEFRINTYFFQIHSHSWFIVRFENWGFVFNVGFFHFEKIKSELKLTEKFIHSKTTNSSIIKSLLTFE